MKYKHIYFLLIIFNLFSNIISFNRSYFYRASSFGGEPRFERDWLSTINTQITGGSTNFSKNKCYKRRNLFNLYGPDKINLDAPINKFYFTGAFDIFEVNLNIYQNFKKNIFIHLHVPAVSAQLFPEKIKFPNNPIDINNGFICNKLNQFTKSLADNNIFLRSVKERGFADTSFFVGYTINYEDTNYLDYIDCTIELGALFATSKKKDPNLAFSIPLGYNGHYGITWIFNLSIGAYDWVTFGIYNDGVGFFDITACRPIRTIESETGLIRINNSVAKIKMGPVYRTGAYIKADHACWGLSILTGFSFEQQNKTTVDLFDINFSNTRANRDDSLQSWNRWNLNILVDYDFAKCNRLLNPFIAIIYNYSITGKRIFNTNMIGGYFGLNTEWTF